MPKTQTKTYVKYTGNGEFLVGIPARDMTKEEWQALSEDQRRLGLELKLYKLVESEPAGGKE